MKYCAGFGVVAVTLIALFAATPAEALCNAKRHGRCYTAHNSFGWNRNCTERCHIAIVNGKRKVIVGRKAKESS